jgi:hypothetical protein
MTTGYWILALLVAYIVGREALHQFLKSRRFKRVCAFLEKASR